MKAQAHSLRPALSYIVRRIKAVRSRFCEAGAGVAYLTLHRGLGPSIAPSRPRLYGLYLLGLQSLISVKATDTGLRNLKPLADTASTKSKGGFFIIRNLSHLLMGVACSCLYRHGCQGYRISQNCNAMPTRLRNGRMVSQNLTLEADHA